MAKPRIAVLLDENTSGDGSLYEASKNYFRAVHAAGGFPFGVPFFLDMAEEVVERYDGLLCTGGRFGYPDDFYVRGCRSPFPPSERVLVEAALMRGFLARDKPVLGVCAGMQMLGCLHGARLVPDVRQIGPQVREHHGPTLRHRVRLTAGSRLAALIGTLEFEVNSRHREAIAQVPGTVRTAARADDGVIEAIELPERRFAIGLQWHQESFAAEPHPGNAVFDAFVQACVPACGRR